MFPFFITSRKNSGLNKDKQKKNTVSFTLSYLVLFQPSYQSFVFYPLFSLTFPGYLWIAIIVVSSLGSTQWSGNSSCNIAWSWTHFHSYHKFLSVLNACAHARTYTQSTHISARVCVVRKKYLLVSPWCE